MLKLGVVAGALVTQGVETGGPLKSRAPGYTGQYRETLVSKQKQKQILKANESPKAERENHNSHMKTREGCHQDRRLGDLLVTE